MKKQFLAIGLLLSSVQVSKPMDLTQYGPGIACAALTVYGLKQANRWNVNTDRNAPGYLQTVGKIAGLPSRDTLTVLNTTTALAALAFFLPAARDVVVSAGSCGALYVISRRLIGANQETNPTSGETVATYTLAGAVAGTIYTTNALPPFTHLVNGVLGKTATNGFYQL
ncbi:MAG: hypothetical protein EBU90_25835 [Proteobacteria bacterium]|nr:hypothetical protein [Pseudomonadota bacterium]NBP16443.1 hypothetical protein [bacterium]